MLTVSGLSKRFGKVQALAGIDFCLGEGVVGLLGPNGAGKTTLLRCIAGIVQADSGEIQAPLNLSYLPQSFRAYDFLTVFEMLHHFAAIRGVAPEKRKAAAEEAAEKVHLQDKLGTYCRHLSGGMMRRLGIAQAFLGAPELVLLDEPTVGLDPLEKEHFMQILASAEEEKQTILLSSHIVGDMEQMCRELLVMDQGKVVFQGEVQALAGAAEGFIYEIPQELVLKEPYLVIGNRYIDGEEYLRVFSRVDQPGTCIKPDLEDGFIALIHRKS